MAWDPLTWLFGFAATSVARDILERAKGSKLVKLRLKPTRSSWWEKPMWA